MRPPVRARQSGVALLLFTFALVIIGATFFVSTWNGKNAIQARTVGRELALQQAKEAVIGFAANSATPGRLVCPERLSTGTPEGQTQNSCTSAPEERLGRFPWRTLKMERLTDEQGEPLWYAVSPDFYDAPINANTIGQLQVDGTANAAVAVIIAPGPPLPGQNRSIPTSANPPQAADYLDLVNVTGTTFVTSGPTATFNDKVLTITNADLAKAVNMRVLAEIRGLDDQAPGFPIYGLRAYYSDNGQFPWADTDSDGHGNAGEAIGTLPYGDLPLDPTPPNWLSNNGWLPLVSYRRLSASNAQISIGSTQLKVVPCTTLPCP